MLDQKIKSWLNRLHIQKIKTYSDWSKISAADQELGQSKYVWCISVLGRISGVKEEKIAKLSPSPSLAGLR